MSRESLSVSFLLSSRWWLTSLALVKDLARHFLPAAILLFVSNLCSVYTDFTLRSTTDLGIVEANQEELQRLLGLCLNLLALGLLGLITGLVSISLWMIKLTALAKFYIESCADSFVESLQKLRGQGKHLGRIWLLAMLYLLIPAVLLSVLLSFSILSGMKLSAFGERLFSLPDFLILPINLLSALLAIIIIDYSLILTVFSTDSKYSPKQAASEAFLVLLRQFPGICLLNFCLVILDILISAPFVLINSFALLPALSENMNFAVFSQIWLALTSMLCWPLSLLVFAEFLKKDLKEQESVAAES